jgi:hypothetical protein
MYWKRRRRKSGNGGAKGVKLWAGACGLLLVTCTLANGADRVKELQDHFDKENHPSGKVKALEKLSEAQFEAATRAGGLGDYATVGLTFEKYRDNVHITLELLKKQDPDVDRHPGGYRQLELQVRRGIREVEETLLVAPPEMRPPLGIVRKDLVDTDDELIRLLFPRRSKDPAKVPSVPEGKP